jgi:hypothetical protein
MAYQKLQQHVDLMEDMAITDLLVQQPVMKTIRSFIATCMLSTAKAGYYLHFGRSQHAEYVLSKKRYIAIFAVRCLGLMSLFGYLSYQLLSANNAIDVQRIGILFDYIVP